MGQACMKTGDGNDNTKKVSKCSKCNYPIIDVIFNSFQVSNHRCLLLAKLEDTRPNLNKSKSHLCINPATLVKFYGAGVFQAQN